MRSCIVSPVKCRPSSVRMPPGWTAQVRTPRSRRRRSSATTKSTFAVRAAVCYPRVVRCAVEAGIVEVDVGHAVAGRRERDDAAGGAGDEERDEAVHEYKVPQMVGAELGLEPI